MTTSPIPHAFNYQYQRLMIGLVALLLPVLVIIFGCDELSSLSISYHSTARDMFVANIYAVGALMIPYQGKNGQEPIEFWVPKIGGISAMLVGLVPMDCKLDELGNIIQPFDCFIDVACNSTNGSIHLAASILVFVALFILCIIFRKHALEKNTPTSRLRAHIYVGCMGGIILGVIISARIPWLMSLLGERYVYWAETIMLISFSIAWLTASKMIIREKAAKP
ncbi:MAG: DUF998 domain-containing protein [Oleiphilus sp.]